MMDPATNLISNQMINSHPFARQMMESNPQFQQMMQNPELLRQMANPQTLQAMLQMQQAVQQLQGTGLFPYAYILFFPCLPLISLAIQLTYSL
jgi:hypothetical protein